MVEGLAGSMADGLALAGSTADDHEQDARLCERYLDELGLAFMAPKFIAASLHGDLCEIVRRLQERKATTTMTTPPINIDPYVAFARPGPDDYEPTTTTTYDPDSFYTAEEQRGGLGWYERTDPPQPMLIPRFNARR